MTRRHALGRPARPDDFATLTPGTGPAPACQEELRPVLGALRAVEEDLRRDRIDAAWVDLDIAALRLAREAGTPGTMPPAGIDKARRAVERARELLGRAEVPQATATIAGAVLALMG